MQRFKNLLAVLCAVLLTAVLIPTMGMGQQRTRQADSYQGVTLRAHRNLERRVEALEKQVKELLGAIQEPPVPPPVRPPTIPPADPVEPPVIRPPSRAPPISVTWKPRGRVSLAFVFPAGGKAEVKRNGIGFHCYTQTAPGIDAQMVTVCAINGYAGRGVAYFEELTFRSGDTELESIKGRHVILPRGALLRRFYLGRDAAKLRSLEWVEDARPVPDWAPAMALNAIGKFAGNVGPYRFQWAFKSLSNSHGGQGVAPFHGGPDDWLTCAEGRRLREQEMLSAYQRPIWLLGDVPPQPYWLGRTMAHRLKGYSDDPDGWCSYAVELNSWRPADHTHLSRQTGAPAALAKWDTFARDALLVSFRDFEMANSLTRPVESGSRLLWPLWKKLEEADGPLNSEGDRGLAHQLRLMRWCRPYIKPERIRPYEAAFRAWAGKMAGQYGYTRTSSPTVPAAAPLVAPYIQAFHQQLNLYEFQQFGGLDAQAALLAAHLTPSPPWYFGARDGRPTDTCLDRSYIGPGKLAVYGAMTHGVLAYPSPAVFLQHMAGRSANGSSQDLDSCPRTLWEPGLSQ